jgi:hypothetical protein
MLMNYSPRLRILLTAAAIGLALLPVPIAILGILPAFRSQRPFFAVYAPFLALLVLAYVLYVRDSLARVMFAHLLHPLAAADESESDSIRLKLRRGLIHARRLSLALVPALLLLLSVFCVFRYMSLLTESITAAAQVRTGQIRLPSDTASATPAERGTVPRGLPPEAPPDSVTPGQYLESTSWQDIPNFTELTLLFVGIFLSPLLAVLLMSVREYAKEALELTETDVVLGRLLTDEGAAAGEPH